MANTMKDGIEMMVNAYASEVASLSKDLRKAISQEKLPKDIASILTYYSDKYIVHGFIIEYSVETIVVYNDKEIYDDSQEFHDVVIARFYGETLPTGYSIQKKNVQKWMALHSGNGFSLEYDLYDAGFINASSSSPHRCHVRALRPEELEKYAEE